MRRLRTKQQQARMAMLDGFLQATKKRPERFLTSRQGWPEGCLPWMAGTKNPAEAGFFDEAASAGSGGLQRLDARGQASLVTGGLVLVDQAAGGETIQQRLRGDERGGCGFGIVGVERLDHLLDGGTQHGALGDVAFVAHDGLLGALLGGLDIGHGENPGVSVGAERIGRRQHCPRTKGSERLEIMGDSMACVNNPGLRAGSRAGRA